ncbi:hypothetical protein E1193_19820 [Micromonospora sp. KC606]|uniref:hypothetical protein n=1 Tax=Micromonospora sp. KC606 TaxID=2530379 RepID=UPI001042A552|nr:hypothetical protein [Micromonospora sp. KC606]TDC78988.1 hypothetical protein E1193_19820 [Micromonospora sp. KC606]
MEVTDPGSAREEAERLVATLLATTRLATSGPGAAAWGPIGGMLSGVLGHSPGASRPAGDGGGSGGFATGAPECCVCPVCRGIAALRDPSPEFAERLATGAGDLAAGIASLLRAFASAGSGEAPHGTPAGTTAGAGADPDGDHVWREATRSGHDSPSASASASASERDVWSAATRAEASVVPAPATPPVDDAGPAAPAQVRSAADRPVVPASRASAGAGGDAPGDGA